LRDGPCSLERVQRIMRYPGIYGRYLDSMERQGVIIRAGLTPTDAAHVLGQYRDWNVEAARLGTEIMGQRLGKDPETLCAEILALTSERIAAEVITKLLNDEGEGQHTASAQDGKYDVLDSRLVTRALRPTTTASLQCALTIKPTIVAIGAPVQTYFPRVAELLHSTVRIPEHTGVANAVGAVVGSVVQREHILIVPQEDVGGFRIHLPDQLQDFQELEAAIAYAEEYGRRLATDGAHRAGAQDVKVQVERHDQTAPVAAGWGEDIYLQTILEVSAVGRPRLAHR
jgi:N-methylhydantoinase A/oxoprolinase/acetone carboxylase beta subunit